MARIMAKKRWKDTTVGIRNNRTEKASVPKSHWSTLASQESTRCLSGFHFFPRKRRNKLADIDVSVELIFRKAACSNSTQAHIMFDASRAQATTNEMPRHPPQRNKNAAAEAAKSPVHKCTNNHKSSTCMHALEAAALK